MFERRDKRTGMNCVIYDVLYQGKGNTLFYVYNGLNWQWRDAEDFE